MNTYIVQSIFEGRGYKVDIVHYNRFEREFRQQYSTELSFVQYMKQMEPTVENFAQLYAYTRRKGRFCESLDKFMVDCASEECITCATLLAARGYAPTIVYYINEFHKDLFKPVSDRLNAIEAAYQP